MERVLEKMSLEDSESDLEEQDKLEPLGEQELKLMNLIKSYVRKRKYKNVSRLFTTGKYAGVNMEMLPNMSMHLLKEVCTKYLTEVTFEENSALYKCAEELLQLIATCAPADFFLHEMMILMMDPDKPDCLFFSALNVLQSPLVRLPEDENEMGICVFEDCLDEIALRRDVCLPVPKYFGIVNKDEIDARMAEEDEVKYIIMFHARLFVFYRPLINEVCSRPRSESEIFRSCKTNKRNVMCCFLIKMLEKPLSLFDLQFTEANANNQCPLFFAVSLTHAITQSLCDPYYLLNFVEHKERWGSQTDLSAKDEEGANYFLKEFPLETECLAIYYYMIIVEGVGETQVPKVYHPLYVCEMGLHLVHSVLSGLAIAAIQLKALRLANRLLKNLGHIKLQKLHLETHIYKVILDDLRKLAHNPLSEPVLVETNGVIKAFVLSFEDEERYFILVNLMETATISCFYGFLTILYKDLLANALKASPAAPLANVYTGPLLQTMLMENICKLQSGDKTNPVENYSHLEAALQVLLTLSKADNNNRTGFWSYLSDIHAKFTSPLRKSIQFYDSLFKSELQVGRQGRGSSSRKGRGLKLSQIERAKHAETLKTNLSDIVKLRILLSVVCDSLSNSPIDDQNNNLKSKSKKVV